MLGAIPSFSGRRGRGRSRGWRRGALVAAGALLVALVVLARPAAAGSCREAKLCCPGRDSSCVVQKAPINAVIEDLSDKPCYCDHACLKLTDCCPDFKDACGETALLLPARWAGGRSPNATSGLRRSRRLHAPSETRVAAAQGGTTQHTLYCVEFEVLKAAKACRKEPAFTSLRHGARACVRCGAAGARCPGRALEGQATRWAALTAPHCRGQWRRLPRALSCAACDDRQLPDFVIV